MLLVALGASPRPATCRARRSSFLPAPRRLAIFWYSAPPTASGWAADLVVGCSTAGGQCADRNRRPPVPALRHGGAPGRGLAATGSSRRGFALAIALGFGQNRAGGLDSRPRNYRLGGSTEQSGWARCSWAAKTGGSEGALRALPGAPRSSSAHPDARPRSTGDVVLRELGRRLGKRSISCADGARNGKNPESA